MKLLLKRNPEAGFNLIEAAIVLGIVGLVVGGIWTAAASAYANMRQQTASKQLLSFAQGIKNYYANSGTTTVETTAANLINAGVVPSDMVQGTNLVGAFGGAVSVTSASGNYTITFSKPTSYSTSDWVKACNEFIMRNANAAGSGITGVSLTSNGTSLTLPLTTSPGCTATSAPSFTFTIQ